MRPRRVLVACALAAAVLSLARINKTVEAAGPQAPIFEVDPLWPKPLPNHWVIGATVGVSADAHDNIWIVQRASSLERNEIFANTNPPGAACCLPAPPVLQYDPAGNLIGHWGGSGPGYEWPESMHGITIDYKGNVWLGANGPKDAQILKFTPGGKFLLQIGHQKMSKGSNDIENLGRAAKVVVDKTTNEAIVADGYGNKRVIVFDADTGSYKRHWGGYGHKPDDTDLGPYKPDAPPAQQFRNTVHCAQLAEDGLIYVCDRYGDRIQVFKRDGTFVKESFIAKNTVADGAVFDIAFSRDRQQKYIYVADSSNAKIRILLRDTLEELTAFGDGGRQPGEFYGLHSIATDSKGNLYTTETYRGQRVQKFVYKGIGPVTKKDQGVVWPKR